MSKDGKQENSKEPASAAADSEREGAAESAKDHNEVEAEQPAIRESYYKDGVATKLATSPIFENVTLLIVGVNAVWIGYDLDMNKNTMLDADAVFVIMDNFFCFYFTFELLVRFIAVKDKLSVFRDPWFMFDLVLVILIIIETWIFTLYELAAGPSGQNPMGTLSLLRMLRLIRLTRLVKIFRAMPELMTLLRAFASAARSCVCTLFLLAVLTYVYAIAFRQFVDRDTDVGMDYFFDVIQSMYTLLVDGLLPDYAPLIRAVEPAGWAPTLIIIIFVLFATFTLLNMLVGILCDVAIRVSKISRDEISYQRVRTSLESIISTRIDKNYDGEISKEEFLGIMQDEQATKVVSSIGVDVSGLSEEADLIYDAVDPDGEEYERKLTFHQFMETIVGMTPDNEVTLKDLNALRMFIDRRASDLERRMATRKAGSSGRHSSTVKASPSASPATSPPATPRLDGGNSHPLQPASKDTQSQASQSLQLPEVAREKINTVATKAEVDQIRQQLFGLRDVASKLVQNQAELSGNIQNLHEQLTSFLGQVIAGGEVLLATNPVVTDGTVLNYSEGAKPAKPLVCHPGDEPENDDEKP